MKTKYWIQEQAPAGNFVDSLGFDPTTSQDAALDEHREWQKSFPTRNTRLVIRADAAISGVPAISISDEDEVVDAEALIDTLVESTDIAKTQSYAMFKAALEALQVELEANGVKGKW